MVLLAAVVAHDERGTVCIAEVDRLSLFRETDGSVGAWVGLELMAQCIAAHAGMVAHRTGEEPRIGLLLGTRRLTLHVPRFVQGQRLRVRARQTWGGDSGMVAFECAIEDDGGELLAEARLNCLLTDEASRDPEGRAP
jgi:predicted hotdog family 3-hydroxylacyl-ACP dehydratase